MTHMVELHWLKFQACYVAPAWRGSGKRAVPAMHGACQQTPVADASCMHGATPEACTNTGAPEHSCAGAAVVTGGGGRTLLGRCLGDMLPTSVSLWRQVSRYISA